MIVKKIISSLLCLGIFCQCIVSQEKNITSASMNKVKLELSVNSKGIAEYSVFYNERKVILPSSLGFRLNDSIVMDSNLKIIKTDTLSVDETWKPVWGEVNSIRNHYKQLTIHLQQRNTPALLLNIVFKVFQDGIGFRYEFPVQPNLKYFIVSRESTQFNLTGDHKTFWIPGDYDSNEYPYTVSPLSEVNAWKLPMISSGTQSTNIPDQYAVQTPLMLKTVDGLYINAVKLSKIVTLFYNSWI